MSVPARGCAAAGLRRPRRAPRRTAPRPSCRGAPAGMSARECASRCDIASASHRHRHRHRVPSRWRAPAWSTCRRRWRVVRRVACGSVRTRCERDDAHGRFRSRRAPMPRVSRAAADRLRWLPACASDAGRHVRRPRSRRVCGSHDDGAIRRAIVPSKTHTPRTIGAPIARPSPSMPPPMGTGAGARGIRTRLRLHVGDAHAREHDAARRRRCSPRRPLGYSFTACQTSLKPSPFLSPFAASFAKK